MLLEGVLNLKNFVYFIWDCIVAPYEADAQLAYLNISGIADFIISEDSDLVKNAEYLGRFVRKNPQNSIVLMLSLLLALHVFLGSLWL